MAVRIPIGRAGLCRSWGIEDVNEEDVCRSIIVLFGCAFDENRLIGLGLMGVCRRNRDYGRRIKQEK